VPGETVPALGGKRTDSAEKKGEGITRPSGFRGESKEERASFFQLKKDGHQEKTSPRNWGGGGGKGVLSSFEGKGKKEKKHN